MTETAPFVAYAMPGIGEPPADRLLRRIIAWSVIFYGGHALVTTALHIALAKKWLASPSTMGWDLDGGLSMVLRVADTLTMAALLVGGVLLLLRSRASILLLRAGVVCSIVLSILSIVTLMQTMPVYRSYRSTPGAAAVEASHLLRSLALPILIFLLTLPPLARRMV